jgi:hypothetical protein
MALPSGAFFVSKSFLSKGLVMKRICVMLIACVLAVSAANTADASVLITKRIEGVKKIADRVSKTVWNNKGAIAVGTVATVALTNPEAATAAVTGTADIVSNAVTGTADVAYVAITSGGSADTVVPRSSVRQSSSGNVIPTVLFYLLFIGLVIMGARYLLHRIGIWRMAVPLLMVGVILLCGGVADAAVIGAVPTALAPVVKPLAHFALWVVTALTIFL